MILVDFHVHLYRCFSLPDLFSAAVNNFQSTVEKAGGRAYTGMLCLTESKGYDVFGQLRDGLKIGDEWVCRSTDEEHSLCLLSKGRKICLIAGRQINTRERVEVLALGTAANIADDLTLADTLELVEHCGALAVLPWGVGKWIGSRGKLVGKILAKPGGAVFPGDNGGRPYGWPEPGSFALAGRNTAVLPGSDPLPLPDEQNRVGSYGAIINESIDEDAPAAQLMAIVHAASSLQSYGRRIFPHTFLVRQLQLKFLRRNC